MAVTLKEIQYQSPAYYKAVELREELLRKPLGLKFTSDFLAADAHDYHLAAFADKQLVGTLQLKPLPEKTRIKMRQAAVNNKLQGKGIGRQLIAFAEEFCRKKAIKTIELHARQHVIDFYLRLGYYVTSNTFTEVGIPHKKMEKKL